jgi:hypothetical protein
MEVIGKILGAVAVTVLVALFMTLPIMWLWNWLMPEIFGLITITFWQTLGLSLLCSFLFKSSNSN